MKRIFIALLSLVMIFAFLSGCGKQKTVELTLDNYEQYLNISTEYSIAGNTNLFYNVFPEQENNAWGDKIEYTIRVEGASANFNYNDVEVKFNVSGKYKPYVFRGNGAGEWSCYPEESILFDVTLKTNIAGDSDIYEKSVPVGVEGGYTNIGLVDTSIEVVSVSGTITAAD